MRNDPLTFGDVARESVAADSRLHDLPGYKDPYWDIQGLRSVF